MADTDKDMRGLDDLLAAARAERPALPQRLETAILADAAGAQDAWVRESCKPARLNRPAARLPRLRQLLAAIGGWPAMGGLAAAGVAGLWLGLAPPDFLPDPVALAGVEADAALPYDDFDLAVVLSGDLQ